MCLRCYAVAGSGAHHDVANRRDAALRGRGDDHAAEGAHRGALQMPQLQSHDATACSVLLTRLSPYLQAPYFDASFSMASGPDIMALPFIHEAVRIATKV